MLEAEQLLRILREVVRVDINDHDPMSLCREQVGRAAGLSETLRTPRSDDSGQFPKRRSGPS